MVKVAQVVQTSEDPVEKIHQSARIDKELAYYVSDVSFHISPERSTELRRKIDKRVLVIMMATYFLQGLDKGTLASASIMGITRDTGLQQANGSPTQQVRICNHLPHLAETNTLLDQ
jgi:hypothetical protein